MDAQKHKSELFLSWVYLFVAIFLEALGTTMMKLSRGFAEILPTILMFVFYGLDMLPYSLSLRKIDVSVAYAIWSGLGTVLITAIGIFIFQEEPSLFKIISITLIIAGVLGLELSHSGHQGIEMPAEIPLEHHKKLESR